MTHSKRPRDPNQLAKSIIDIATADESLDRLETDLQFTAAFRL